MSVRTLRRTVGLPASLAIAASVLAPAAAHADQVPVLQAQHGNHAIYVAPDEGYTTEDPSTYWDFVPLDGMCGFAGTRLVLDNMEEVFGINTKTHGPQAGSFTGTGKIVNETFTLDELDSAGNVVRTYEGGAVELAQFRGTGEQGPHADISTNLTVRMQGTSADGHRLGFMIKARFRVDHLDKSIAEVTSCHVN